MRIFLSVIFSTLYSFAGAQESSVQMADTSNTPIHHFDSTTFVLRTDVLDLLPTLLEENKFALTIGIEYFINKNYSVRLLVRKEQINERTFSTTEFRSGPEFIKYFAENADGSFYGGVFVEYFVYKIIKQDGNHTLEKLDKFFIPGITAGYSYSATEHIVIEPSIRIGYGSTFHSDNPLELRIGLYVGYRF
ncbi:MAG: DUF3575 domain-containing protein [Bacteroidia bacterium]|nr:DUF3575 domain-containing protein [Bacteroidia bacterium]